MKRFKGSKSFVNGKVTFKFYVQTGLLWKFQNKKHITTKGEKKDESITEYECCSKIFFCILLIVRIKKIFYVNFCDYCIMH